MSKLSGFVSIFVTAGVALLLSACGGSAGVAAPQLDNADLQALLPPLAEVDRSASEEVNLTKEGFEPFTMSAGAVVNGTGLDLNTGQPSLLEFAVYRFALTDKVPRKYTTDVTVDAGQYWLAVGNYKTGLWEFNGPYTASVPELQTLPSPDYKSTGKNAVIAVIAATMGEVDTDMTINSITLLAAGGTTGEL